MKQFVTWIVLWFTCTTISGQELTLAECIQVGINHNLSLHNARIGIEKRQTAVSQNRARLLPVIQGVAQWTDYLDNPVNVTTGTLLGNDFPDDPTWQTIKSMTYNSQVGLQLSMPLYAPTISADLDVARAVERISRLSLEKAKEELTVQIAKVYYLAQSTKAQLQLTEMNINRMETLCQITEALYDQGVVMLIDLNRVRINLKTLQANRNVQQTLQAQQLNMLRYLLDLPLDAPLDVTTMDQSFSPLTCGAESFMLPEEQLAEKQKNLISLQLKSLHAAYLPTVSLTAYAGGLGYNEKFLKVFDHWFGNCFVGVTVKMPIFDGHAKKLRKQQYLYDAEQAQNNLDIVRKQIARSRADATLQLTRNIDLVKTQQECARQAEDVYAVAEEQYREGVASMTALLQDDMQLRQAQSSCVQAVCQCYLAQLDLLKQSGNLQVLSK